MSGKKARGRSDKAKRAAAAAKPLADFMKKVDGDINSVLAMSEAQVAESFELMKKLHVQQLCSQTDVSSEATSAAPTHASVSVTGAELARYTKLLKFVTGIFDGIKRENDSLIASEFADDVDALAAAADTGDAKALLALFKYDFSNKRMQWMTSLAGQDYDEMNLFMAVSATQNYLSALCMLGGPRIAVANDRYLSLLRSAAQRGLATAQHILGMLMYCSLCDAGSRAEDKVYNLVDAARWIRKAAMQGFAEAQYELGEMLRRSLFCKVNMRFARKYIRRASVQGHAEAIVRMKELRSCALCGVEDARLACSLCRQARYCDSVCSEKHWCEGGGVVGGVNGGGDAAHRDTCPRAHTRGS